jgi:hypothetical protein
MAGSGGSISVGRLYPVNDMGPHSYKLIFENSLAALRAAATYPRKIAFGVSKAHRQWAEGRSVFFTHVMAWCNLQEWTQA